MKYYDVGTVPGVFFNTILRRLSSGPLPNFKCNGSLQLTVPVTAIFKNVTKPLLVTLKSTVATYVTE
jgi:hypothetical protein